MGFLNNGGQGAQSFADNFMKAYQVGSQNALRDAQVQEFMAQAAERKRQTANESAMREELLGLFKPPQTAQEMAFAPGVIEGGGNGPARLTEQGVGMMEGQPSLESYLSVLGKYKPEQALTARVSLQNTDERLKSAQKIQEAKNTAASEALAAKLQSAIDLLTTKQDYQSRALADTLQNKLDQITTKGGFGAKAPIGYRNTPDGGLEPIPGGPADLKQQDAFTKASSAKDSIINNLDMVAAKANALITHPGLGKITGLASMFPNIPGGDAANAKAALDSLKASAGLDTLVSLKQGSGAGLGQVTEAEHKLLQNYITSLEQAQSEAAIKKSLGEIANWTQKAKSRISNAYDTRWGSKGTPVTQSTPTNTPRFTIKQVR